MEHTQVCFTLTAELIKTTIIHQHSFLWVWTSFHPQWPSQHVCYVSAFTCCVHVLRTAVFWAVEESWWLKLVWALFTLPLARLAFCLLCSGSFLHKGERKISPSVCLCAAQHLSITAVKLWDIIYFQLLVFKVFKEDDVSCLNKTDSSQLQWVSGKY